MMVVPRADATLRNDSQREIECKDPKVLNSKVKNEVHQSEG